MKQINKTILIIGLIATVMTFSQASWASWAGGMFDEPSLFHGGNAGRFIAVLFAVAAIFALFRLFISMTIFAAAGLVAIILGLFMGYYDIVFWGTISIVLAVLCYFARQETEDFEEFDEEFDQEMI